MTTPHLKLTELANGQANYLNGNEAFAWLDALTQARVISMTLTAAPASPADGDRYVMASAWSGVTGAAAGAIALYRTGLGWTARTPEAGWKVENAADGTTYRYSGTAWATWAAGGGSGGTTQTVAISSGTLALASVTADTILTSLDQNITAITLPAGTAGQRKDILLRLTQDATGGRTVAGWPPGVTWEGGSAPAISTTANAATFIMLSNLNNEGWFGFIDQGIRPDTTIQTLIANAATTVSTAPNGTGSGSSWQANSSSDTSNSSFGRLGVSATSVTLESGRNGSGSYLPLIGNIGGSERYRVNTTGGFCVNQVNDDPIANQTAGMSMGAWGIRAMRAAGAALALSNSTDGSVVSFYRATTAAGTITVSSTGTSYNTTSDRRLKDDIEDADLQAAYDGLDKYEVYSLVYKADPSYRIRYSWVADQLQTANPDMVTGDPDAEVEVGNLYVEDHVVDVDVEEPSEMEDGVRWEKTGTRPVYQMVNNPGATPEIFAILKFMKSKIEALEAEVAELKGAKS